MGVTFENMSLFFVLLRVSKGEILWRESVGGIKSVFMERMYIEGKIDKKN